MVDGRGDDEQVQTQLQGEVLDNETTEAALNISNGLGNDHVYRYTRAFLLNLQASPHSRAWMDLELFTRDEEGNISFVEHQPEPPNTRSYRERPGLSTSLSFEMRNSGRGRGGDIGRWGRRDNQSRYEGDCVSPGGDVDNKEIPAFFGSNDTTMPSKAPPAENIVLGPQRSMLFACSTKGSESPRHMSEQEESSRIKERPDSSRRRSMLYREGRGGVRVAERSDSYPLSDRDIGGRLDCNSHDRGDRLDDRDLQNKGRTGKKYVAPSHNNRILGPNRNTSYRDSRDMRDSRGMRDTRDMRDNKDARDGRPMRPLSKADSNPEWLTYAPDAALDMMKLQGLPEREEINRSMKANVTGDHPETTRGQTDGGKTSAFASKKEAETARPQETEGYSGKKEEVVKEGTIMDQLLHSEFFQAATVTADSPHPRTPCQTPQPDSTFSSSRFSDIFGTATNEVDYNAEPVDANTSRFSNLFDSESAGPPENHEPVSRFQHLFSDNSTPEPVHAESKQTNASKPGGMDVLQLLASMGVSARTAGHQQAPENNLAGLFGSKPMTPGIFGLGPQSGPHPPASNEARKTDRPMPTAPGFPQSSMGAFIQPPMLPSGSSQVPNGLPSPQTKAFAASQGTTGGARPTGKISVAFNGFTPTSVMKAAGKKKAPEPTQPPQLPQTSSPLTGPPGGPLGFPMGPGGDPMMFQGYGAAPTQFNPYAPPIYPSQQNYGPPHQSMYPYGMQIPYPP
eukprot:Ihof_evm3s511 gene=Ihof_evmTU3s511